MSSVLDKDQAEKVVVTYTPRKFPLVISPVAKEFFAHQSAQGKSSFRIDPVNAVQTGIAELERVSIEEKVEILALEKVKQIQEEAYQQAYQLGLDEGRERALASHQRDLEEKLGALDQLVSRIGSLKTELTTANESYLMKLLYYMASRVAMDEIHARPEVILSILRQSVEDAQSEEKVTVRVSRQDYEFISSAKEKLGKDVEFVKRIKFEESDSIAPGGCVVETNYGSVDATIEKRLIKLWETIAEKMPKVNDTVGDT
ncbi:MAG: FliH/SctL family protein [Bdellovibrionaceae bacterium]|nr:FliH/SctL family protein [Pseudobdellovibrionaceae bacterium]